MLKCIIPFLLCVACMAQHGRGSKPQPIPTHQMETQRLAAEQRAMNNLTPVDLQQRMEREQAANAFAERQSELRQDAEKLVALAAELKQHVESTGSNFLSMDVIKKAREIQKLAKSVEDKMKNIR